MRGGLAYSNQQKNGKGPGNIAFPPKKEITISKETKEKAEIAKMYIQGTALFKSTKNKKNIKNCSRMNERKKNTGINW
jgi:hypothetical protein